MTFQCADVNKILACIGGIADAGNAILFGATGGHILNLDEKTRKAIEKLIEGCQTKTAFDRRGMVYVMDAYVKVAPHSKLAQQVDMLRRKGPKHEGFQRQEER